MAAYFHHHQKMPPADITTAINHFTIDDLLVDFPNDDTEILMNDAFFHNFTSNNNNNNSTDNNNNSSFSGSEPNFSTNLTSFSGAELPLPYDELAELEWLSSFTEESFSTDDLRNLQLISAVNKTPATDTSSSDTDLKTLTSSSSSSSSSSSNRINNSPIFQTNVLIPAKIRSKRSRAAPCDWSSRLILLKSSSSSSMEIINLIKSESIPLNGSENSVRRCLHCRSDKTPQWRRGPMGPKTLCNACGVRYKSGRLVPEYRPAASPSFVPAKHSNSHRKVMELRRQMELRNSFINSNHNSGSDGCNSTDDYLIHSQMGPNFMHMI